MFDNMHTGRFWETPTRGDLVEVGRLAMRAARKAAARVLPALEPPPEPPPMPTCPVMEQ